MFVKESEENYKAGWIKIFRSVKTHWIWQDAEYFRLWVDFLIRANHAENKILIDSNLVNIQKGEFITSLKKLAKESKCSLGRIRRFLEILKNDSMIELKTTHKYTQITVCNYESYQNGQHTDGNGNETGMKSDGNQTETNKNYKNYKNVKNNKEETILIKEIEIIKKDYFIDLLAVDSKQEFIEAWVEWVNYRKETKHKVTPLSAKKQIDFLNKQPNPVEVIEVAIRNSWQGLFEIRKNGKEQNGKPDYKQPREGQEFPVIS